MNAMWRSVVGGIAVLNILIGLAFLIFPAEVALSFYLAPLGIQGMATLRADFTAFFVVGGTGALVAAMSDSRVPLLVPITLLGVALTGRLVSLVADGTAPTAVAPMLAEAAMIALLGFAWRGARA